MGRRSAGDDAAGRPVHVILRTRIVLSHILYVRQIKSGVAPPVRRRETNKAALWVDTESADSFTALFFVVVVGVQIVSVFIPARGEVTSNPSNSLKTETIAHLLRGCRLLPASVYFCVLFLFCCRLTSGRWLLKKTKPKATRGKSGRGREGGQSGGPFIMNIYRTTLPER